MTPYLTRHAMTALKNKSNADAWTIAVLSRAKKIPKLAEIITDEKPDKKQMEKDLKQALMNYSGGKNNG